MFYITSVMNRVTKIAIWNTLRSCKVKMFVLLILFSMFHFLYVILGTSINFRFTSDSIVKIITSIREEGQWHIIVQLKKKLKSRPRTDILHI